jgi:hypothetical protein
LLTVAIAVADLAEDWTAHTRNATLQGVAVAPDGTVFWVGSQGRGLYLQRNDGSDGSRDWRKKVTSASKGELGAVAVSADGSFVVLGGADGSPGMAGRSPWVARYSADKGKKAWATTIDEITSGSVAAVAIAPDGSSQYVVGSYYTDPGTADERIFVARLDVDGNVLWVKTFGDEATNLANAVAVDPKSRGVYVGGATGDTTGATSLDTLLQMYDPDGNLMWSKRGDGTGNIDVIRSILVSANGKKIYAAGITDATDDFGSRDVFFQQFRANNGKGKRWKVFDLAGGFEVGVGLAMSGNGKTLFMAATGCPADGGDCGGYLLQTNNRGKQQGKQNVLADLPHVSLTHVVVGADDAPIVGAGTGNDAVLRKLTQ